MQSEFSKIRAAFEAAQEAAKVKAQAISSEISALENNRLAVLRTAPHTDDIVAVFMRGLDQSTGEFERGFASHLKAVYGGDDAAEAASPRRFAGILRMEPDKLTDAQLQDRALRREKPAINDTVIAYFLRDKIAAEIPALVEKLFPASRNGMKEADRAQALAALDTKISALRAERDAIVAEMAAARQAVNR